jgi:hypothetical protein
MALDASAFLGAAQIAGVPVNRRGGLMADAMRNASFGVGGAVAGAVGAVAQPHLDRRVQAKAPDTPAFKGTAYLAVTSGEIADSSQWAFDVPLGSKGAAQEVARLLSS